MSGSPLRLFWYRQVPNFGDAISEAVTAHVSGRAVHWAARDKAEIYGLGSLMEMIAHNNAGPRADGSRPFVWGTGCMTDDVPDFKDNVQVAMVRGPISARILGVDFDGYGDPGLLIADALGETPERTDRIALVPHLQKRAQAVWAELAAEQPRIKVIDVTQPDPLQVVREIASCAYVISSSLHGMIVADAFGIPNIWKNPHGNHPDPRLKFYDYAASVGRVLPEPLGMRQILPFIAAGVPDGIGYGDGIAASKAALYSSFPKALKASARLQGAA